MATHGYDLRKLRRARLVQGLTFSEIARQIGVHFSTVMFTLKGVRQNPETVKKIAQFLRVPMDELVPYEPRTRKTARRG